MTSHGPVGRRHPGRDDDRPESGRQGVGAFASLLASKPPAALGQRLVRRSRASDAVTVILLPWLIFVLVVCLFLFAYRDLPILVWALVGLTVLLAFMFMFLGVAAKRVIFLALGFICLSAVIASSMMGLFLDQSYLQRARVLETAKVYHEVMPKGPASNTSDAGIVSFTQGTFVDDRRTLGFVAGGSIFCVAPVVAPGLYSRRIEYWASGRNCCEKRTNFDCGSARDLDAVAAVVEPSPHADSPLARAVAEAVSVYNLETPKTAQVVAFVADPWSVGSQLFEDATNFAVLATLLHLAVSCVMGVAVLRFMPVQPLAK